MDYLSIKSVTMNRNALRAIILLGSLLATARAQAAASSAAFQDPAESVKFYKKGLEQRDAGEFQAAAESFKKAIEIDPSWPLAHLDLGVIYVRLNDFPAAIKAFAKATELDPNFAEAHFNLGSVYFTTGANDAAIKSLREALRIKPDLDMARRTLAAVYERVGRKEEAATLSKSERTSNHARHYYMITCADSMACDSERPKRRWTTYAKPLSLTRISPKPMRCSRKFICARSATPKRSRLSSVFWL